MHQFGKLLANSEKKVRDKAFKDLSKYLESHPNLSSLEYLKLWKGLHYCFWMSDKSAVQEEFASQIAAMVFKMEHTIAMQFLGAFWITISREWYNIDGLRLNKFYMLLREIHKSMFKYVSADKWTTSKPNDYMNILVEGPLAIGATAPASLKYHTLKAFFEELNNAVAEGVEKPSFSAFQILLDPFLNLICQCGDELIIRKFFEDVIDSDQLLPFIELPKLAMILYPLPERSETGKKNKQLLTKYLKEIGERIEIPFSQKIVITGMDVEEKEVPLTMEQIEVLVEEKLSQAKTKPAEKKIESTTTKIINPKKKLSKTKQSTEKQESKILSPEIAADGDDAIVPESAIVELDVIQKAPVFQEAKRKKNLEKKSQLKSSSPTKHAKVELKVTKANPEDEKPRVSQAIPKSNIELNTERRKSVSWGSNEIKPFFKRKTICSNEEAQRSPTITTIAKPVLKQTDYVPLISEFTVGQRKSKRRRRNK